MTNEKHLTLEVFCERLIEEIREAFPRIYTQRPDLMFTHMKMAQVYYDEAIIENEGFVKEESLRNAIF
jgi:hypothetical protein